MQLEYNLIDYVTALDVNNIKSEVEKMLGENIEPKEIQRQMLIGLYEIGKKYESGEYYIGDLIVSGMMMKDILSLEKMKDPLSFNNQTFKGKVMLGTVSDDIHDIGKDILKQMLAADGFEVIDLGVDVPADRFVEEIQKHKPDIVGLSCILTTSINNIFKTIKGIEEAGLRNHVKIIVGGAAMNKKYFKVDAADAFTNDAYEGLQICEQWMLEKR
ncbi:cobalamin-binding protein [Geosporobacter ferrireducens]|uniref:Cobalamin-binding protein n=1 Tax=Geosporobacter ferrireducens TaxID=1424294 RepID=A0A1D8GQM1_9FIRM|nr:cobalamin-binding protein [Geosporobacter ferrireducens]MTI53707.1 cobalamin-binding protein [Geosporobacter ferrireducens]